MKKSKLYEIEWVDAVSQSGWHIDQDLPELLKVKTLGYLLHDTVDAIHIVQTIAENGDYGNIMSIPKGMVVKKKLLR